MWYPCKNLVQSNPMCTKVEHWPQGWFDVLWVQQACSISYNPSQHIGVHVLKRHKSHSHIHTVLRFGSHDIPIWNQTSQSSNRSWYLHTLNMMLIDHPHLGIPAAVDASRKTQNALKLALFWNSAPSHSGRPDDPYTQNPPGLSVGFRFSYLHHLFKGPCWRTALISE